MQCPECSNESFGPFGVVQVHPDRDAYDSPGGTRGEFVSVRTECELCKTQLLICVGNHKGGIDVTVVPVA